jgi:ATP-dependent DNA helicase RecQ
VARLTDLGHGQALRELLRDTTPDGPVPVPLVRAVIEVLDEWRPHVDGIVQVDSTRRAALTRDLADGLSRYLGVPLLGTFEVVDPGVAPGAGAANSAQRVAAVHRRHRLRVAPAAVAGRRVLLVDDLVVTGWTLTVAADELATAGAAAVLPLALARQA